MESEFSPSSEQDLAYLRNQSSNELLQHVLNPNVITKVLEDIAIIAAERDNTLQGELARANDKLIDALAIKISERLAEKEDIDKLYKRVAFYVDDEKAKKSIFDSSDPPTEQALRHLIEGLNTDDE